MKWVVSESESGEKLVTFLKSKIGEKASARQLKSLIENNKCRINDRIERFASHLVGKGDVVIFDWQEQDSLLNNTTIISREAFIFDKSRILYEDEDLMIYNKPSGIASDQQGLEKIVKNVHPAWHLVHRLDKETTGALIFAKSEEAFQSMVHLFHEMLVEKTYLAIVDGIVKKESGVIENTLGKVREYHGQTLWGVVPEPKGHYAKTEWACLKKGSHASLMLCKPKTGRTHQLRVHMAGLQHSIIGDFQYGRQFKSTYKPSRILLHAYRLTFPHPMKNQTINTIAPIPKDFAEAQKNLNLQFDFN